MRTVLHSLFGRQEAFFRLNQEVAARNIALLVKKIKGKDAIMLDIVDALREHSILAMMIKVEKTPSYKRDGILVASWRLDSMREGVRDKERFNYTDLLELPKYHAVIRTVSAGESRQPVLGKLKLSNWDKRRWKKDVVGIKDILSKKRKIKMIRLRYIFL